MKTLLIPTTALALLALTACQSSTTTTTTSSTTQNTAAAEKPKVELPPAIKAEVNFRCHGDNSSAKVTFFEGDKLATVSNPSDAPPVKLTAPEAGQPLTAEGGYSMTGTPKSIKLTVPGKPTQTCDA